MRKLASKEYISELSQLHKENTIFGTGSVTKKHYSKIEQIIKKGDLKTVLDYGCGKGDFIKYLAEALPNISTDGFDIANKEYAELKPKSYDLVVALDVLEHIEFGLLTNVLSEIRMRTNNTFFCTIANYPARKILSDGRNAHLIQLPFGNWFSILSCFFQVNQFLRTGLQEGLFICSKLGSNADWR
jgi:2-polyprenyl-3-methyl-5-hydroxy-6-metoxy-1,4-benzoquinol methylase